jgi:hypothetical protein
MPFYQCRFCDYNTKYKNQYYIHIYTHNKPDNGCKLSEYELKLCKTYYSKLREYEKKYYQNNKERRERKIQQMKEYRQNNKDKQKKYYQNNKDILALKKKEYRQRKKLEKQLQDKDIDDDDIIIEDNDDIIIEYND